MFGGSKRGGFSAREVVTMLEEKKTNETATADMPDGGFIGVGGLNENWGM